MPDNYNYIQGVLDSIYAPAFVDFTVDKMALNLDITDSLGVVNTTKTWINNANTSDHMSFTYQEKQVRKAMKKLDAYDSDKYYLFFFDTGKRTDLNGYMVFKSHFGFIFKLNQNPDEIARSIAHEIAHGAFRLRHTFSDKNKYIQTEGSTTNLMDYVDASRAQSSLRLLKYQWDFIHDPESITVSDEETEERESTNANYYYAKHTEKTCESYTGIFASDYYTYYAPSGLPFSLPNTACEETYSEELYNALQKSPLTISPKALTSFKYNDETYVAKSTNTDFIGYVVSNYDLNQTEDPLQDTYSPQHYSALNIFDINGIHSNQSYTDIKDKENYTAAGPLIFPVILKRKLQMEIIAINVKNLKSQIAIVKKLVYVLVKLVYIEELHCAQWEYLILKQNLNPKL